MARLQTGCSLFLCEASLGLQALPALEAVHDFVFESWLGCLICTGMVRDIKQNLAVCSSQAINPHGRAGLSTRCFQYLLDLCSTLVLSETAQEHLRVRQGCWGNCWRLDVNSNFGQGMTSLLVEHTQQVNQRIHIWLLHVSVTLLCQPVRPEWKEWFCFC